MDRNKQNKIDAAEYYLKLLAKKGKLFYPKNNQEIVEKVVSKYSIDVLVSDYFYKAIINAKYNVMSGVTSPIFEFLKLENENAGIALAKSLSGSLLKYMETDFFECFNDSRDSLAAYVEKCVLDYVNLDELYRVINRVEFLDMQNKTKEGYNFSLEMKLLYQLVKNADKETEEIIDDYKKDHEFYSSYRGLKLLNELVNVDIEKAGSIFNETKGEDLMYLLTDANLIDDLINSQNEIKNRFLYNKLEIETERRLFNDLYEQCFPGDTLVPNKTFNKETIIRAIESNIEFLCNDYCKSYQQGSNGIDEIKERQASIALATLLKETRNAEHLAQIYFNLNKKDSLLDSFEMHLEDLEVNEFLYFTKGNDCEEFIETALLKDAKDYEKALEIEKGVNGLIKVNQDMVEKVAYKLVRFPTPDFTKNEENSKLILDLNNKFAIKRMTTENKKKKD